MVHRVDVDCNYTSELLSKDIDDIKVALTRIYQYVCKQYGWEEQVVSL